MPNSEAAKILAQLTQPRAHFLRVVASSTLTPPVFSASHLFSVRDRILAHSWISDASSKGYGKLVFAHADGPSHAEPGEYLLVYRRDVAWAQWGIGCRQDGYTLWHATRGTTMGFFARLQLAFDAILAQPA